MNKLLTRLIPAWDRYWFSSGALTRLAVYRIGVFSIILIFFLYLETFIARRPFFAFLWLACPVFFNFEKIGAAIRRRLAAPRGLTKFAVLFDGQCPLCIRSVTTVDFLDWRGKFVFRDVNDWEQIARDYPGLDRQKSLEEMQVMIPRHGGYEALAGFYAFRKIAQHLPLGMLAWPFLFIPGVPFVGARIYRFIASRRKRMSGGARCSFHACAIPASAKTNRRTQL
jgi:predicted DCC family thiol-disulfide oxidoreductase YuxK